METSSKTKLQNQKFIKTMVDSASPLHLILILLEGASQWLNLAKQELAKNQTETAPNWTNFSHYMNMSIDILTHLQESLDHKQAPDFAERSFALYDFLKNQLFKAKINHDVNAIDTVVKFLKELKSHWQAIKT